MARWTEIETDAPDFANTVRRLFDSHRHKVLATLRKDGSPRVSGIELEFRDGELWFGTMPESLKGKDLLRDPRLALHSASEDPGDNPSSWPGDAKLSGRAVEVTEPEEVQAVVNGAADPAESHAFRVDISEVVHTRVGDPADHLVIEFWKEGEGLRRVTRR
jgi:nitroimidazol reductase NimA-like FMN-containing flavoprotein (pyridoxamine 5'-phosphate oxidase superfamily)